MRKFKIFDVWVNVGLIFAAFIFAIISQKQNFIIGYFVVGAWQIISMLVHVDNDWFREKGSTRRLYHNIVLIIIIISVLSIFSKLLFAVLILLLFVSPFMAIFYTILCYRETYIKMKHPLDDLK
ncbi:MAG: hypothetical protein KA319_09165 [Ferruginibacter sp.]|nr:hypothetical protein [Ferruginibacter sp.]